MEQITVSGIIEEIIYNNPDNGYTVCEVDSHEDGMLTATGYMPYISEGESVSLTGCWTTHPDYGEQFRVDYYETILPTDEESILKYLASGVIKGIREATAKKLVDRFGADILQILLSEPERIAEIKGISREKAKSIGDSYRELQSMQNIVMFLQQYNVNANIAVKVHNIFGANAVDAIKENPYILSDKVDGVSFKTSDTIAFNMGLPKNSSVRLRAGVKYILQNAAFTSGHTYLPKSLLTDHAVYKLQVEEAEIENAVAELMLHHEIYADRIENEDVYYLYSYYEAEHYIARRLASMSIHEQKFVMTEKECENCVSELEESNGISLAPEQRDAVITAISSGCMVLTGGPGTGKTTTINAIIEIFDKMKLSVALAAPTGRAAKRMGQVTGCEAKTIHRLLGTQAERDGLHSFIHTEENPLTADVIILDEVSMVDINLMASFLKAVKRGARLILSGDSDQLPSVGPGNVLHDIIDSGTLPVIRLNRIFRQAEQSTIIVNAHKINRGKMPDLSVKDSDFFFLRRGSAEQSAFTIVELFKSRLPKSYGIDPVSSIQVLSPTKKGVAGTISLNKMLQLHINPPEHDKEEHTYGNTIFRTGDKVIQTKNNYDMPYSRLYGEPGMGIYNGDMGIIDEINTADKYMTVIFDDDKQVEYPFTNLDELDLAYAITVHKSQGSEFPYVLMPVCSFSPMLMSRNLLYTAVTRARDMVILTGSEKTINAMTQNNSYGQRFTGLNQRLLFFKEIIEQENKGTI